jgi:hypothetical protein
MRSILGASGWTEVDVQPADAVCTMPQEKLPLYAAKLGPVGHLLSKADEETRRRVLDVVLPAFSSYIDGSEVRFSAACWMVTATS